MRSPRRRLRLVLALGWVALGWVALAAPATSSAAAATSAGAVVGRFHLQSRFWIGLHQTLFEAAQRGGIENPGAGEAERAAWDAAVAAYEERFAESNYLYDEVLVGSNDRLSSVEDAAPVPALPGGLEAVLRPVAEVYRARLWPAHERANRFFVSTVAGMLADAGEELVAAHERAYGAPYPAKVVVDIAPYGGRFGAYTTIHRGFAHTTMSSRDPSYQGFKSLEMVLHESSHAVVGVDEGVIGPEIAAAAEALGRRPPRQLWHAVLFYTSGELTRRALEARAVPYRPYAHDEGLYDRAFRGTLPAIESHWQAWLDGELSREEAIRRMVQSSGEP